MMAATLVSEKRKKRMDRFLARVEKTETCWNWKGIKTLGYGRLNSSRNEYELSHRVAYRLFKGSIPEGFHIDHLCRNRGCVNPEHLEAVKPRINTMRGVGITAINAKKTECLNGHPFNSKNTYLTSRGFRMCKECHRLREAARRKGIKQFY
jgi:hypothetical protein